MRYVVYNETIYLPPKISTTILQVSNQYPTLSGLFSFFLKLFIFHGWIKKHGKFEYTLALICYLWIKIKVIILTHEMLIHQCHNMFHWTWDETFKTSKFFLPSFKVQCSRFLYMVFSLSLKNLKTILES